MRCRDLALLVSADGAPYDNETQARHEVAVHGFEWLCLAEGEMVVAAAVDRPPARARRDSGLSFALACALATELLPTLFLRLGILALGR